MAIDLERTKADELARQVKLKATFKVCVGSGCLSSKSDILAEKLRAIIGGRGLSGDCEVKLVGCRGLCAVGPLVRYTEKDTLYSGVTEGDLEAVADDISRMPCGGKIVDTNSSFFKRQEKVVLDNAGSINPLRIEEYIAFDGYFALKKVLGEMSQRDVVETVAKSGLRGRGGAGFPTGTKWKLLAEAAGDEKYVICNGDEGDPGAFMDRSIMEADPHKIIEGMAIAGYATGASKGYIYVRAEYPLAIKRLEIAIEQATEMGLLGENIFGSDFSFQIKLRLGAGAFVCGEETALIASIEGKRGNPSPRPPFPTQSGLFGKPTMINNVETLGNIARIIRDGAEWFASIGTEKSKGTKVFALTGHVVNAGLVEVPMGMTLREIIFDIGGGVANGKKFKAVQTGGPSGGVIPEKYLDTPISYESLAALGSIMGSGGMLVMDEDDCMVDVAKFYLQFCVDESCGKCAPCRIGGYQMLKILEKIVKGRGEIGDLDKLEKIARAMKTASLCGLGQTAANPVMSTLRYFRQEYVSYIEGGVKYARQMKKG
ncbi:MAG: NADH-quinone oxidoreductase subunit NuoF [Puniceicoccales bacterium]|jgi:NADH:ubiquinone oxidoreductase subunit F (NADH-binding)/(2Fe-2S) ferredoxin|nr:NADH-quinone oxidoreductase subunit NuoF [Puniceicoccales bacterium]